MSAEYSISRCYAVFSIALSVLSCVLCFTFVHVVGLFCRALLDKRVERLTQTVAELESKLKQQRSAVAYFESLADRSSAANSDNDDSSCIICFEQFVRRTLTPCGHIFCNACIKSCVAANGSCPTCRKNVSEDQLIEVKVRIDS